MLLFLILMGCAQPQEKPIYLVCNGIETLTSWQNGIRDSDRRKVTISLSLKKEKRNVAGYVISHEKSPQNISKEVYKDIWVLVVDNSREVYLKSTIDNSSGYESVSTHQNALVTPNEVSASQHISVTSEHSNINRYESFMLNVNRVSGQFHMSLLESYPKSHGYRTVTEGECRKADKTF